MTLDLQPQAIMDRRIAKKKNQVITQVLIYWKGLSLVESTWEITEGMAVHFYQFNLKDKKVVMREELSHIATRSMVGDRE